VALALGRLDSSITNLLTSQFNTPRKRFILSITLQHQLIKINPIKPISSIPQHYKTSYICYKILLENHISPSILNYQITIHFIVTFDSKPVIYAVVVGRKHFGNKYLGFIINQNNMFVVATDIFRLPIAFCY